VNDQLLEDVYVHLEPQDEPDDESDNWQIELNLPIKSLPVSKTDVNYVLLKMPEDGRLTGTFNATLKFKVRDVDPATGEPESEEFYADVYAVWEFFWEFIGVIVWEGEETFILREAFPSSFW